MTVVSIRQWMSFRKKCHRTIYGYIVLHAATAAHVDIIIYLTVWWRYMIIISSSEKLRLFPFMTIPTP